MLEAEDESPARGRARSRSFRNEEEEMLQRGVVPESLTNKSEGKIAVSGKTEEGQGKDTAENSKEVSGSGSEAPTYSDARQTGAHEERRNSNDPLLVAGKSKPTPNYTQYRDVGAVSQKTLNSVRNIQDPVKLQQNREKTEAELAEEELERSSLAKGFLTTTQFDYYVKILLLGESGVGKTSLMLRFAENDFQETLIGTAGVDFKVRYLEKKGIRTKCQIWDTAGQQKFHVITRAYYRGAHGIALVYDAADLNSFNKIGYWMENIKNHASGDVFLVLIANKVDLPNRQVSHEQGKAMAEKHGYKFFETSAKTGKNVVEAFETVSQMVVSQMQKSEEKKTKNDSLTPLRAQQRNIIQGKKRSCCLIM